MAAIAYVTDEKMLEYHRYNGSGSIAFWRFSNKKFSDFKSGDLLFFLAKSEDGTNKREKGLVGYGCFVNESTMSIDAMWKKYQQSTGYNTKNELKEAILKSSKNDELPEKVNCIFLDKIIFFQSPVYLSKLGYNISNKLESYTYLDRNQGYQTLQILKEGKNIGLDSWSAMINDNVDDEIFHQQIIQYSISTIFEKLKIVNKVNSKKANEIIKKYGRANSVWVNQDYGQFINFNEKINLNIIYDPSSKDEYDSYYKLLGMIINLKEEFFDEIDETIRIIVLSTKQLTEKQQRILNERLIEVRQIQ